MTRLEVGYSAPSFDELLLAERGLQRPPPIPDLWIAATAELERVAGQGGERCPVGCAVAA